MARASALHRSDVLERRRHGSPGRLALRSRRQHCNLRIILLALTPLGKVLAIHDTSCCKEYRQPHLPRLGLPARNGMMQTGQHADYQQTTTEAEQNPSRVWCAVSVSR